MYNKKQFTNNDIITNFLDALKKDSSENNIKGR
jgi:hypothetical protein